MPWHIQVQAENPIIEITYTGWLSITDLNQAEQAILENANSYQIQLFLADCTTIEGSYSITDLYDLATGMATWNFGQPWRKAVLRPRLRSTDERLEFWATVARNRGLVVRLFDERDAAIAWLLQAPHLRDDISGQSDPIDRLDG